MSDPAVTVSIDLSRVRHNAESILRQTGVPIIAVVKANAYGLGAAKVAETIGDLVDAFYVFDAAEAIAANLWDRTHRRTVALHGSSDDADDYLSQHIQPVVWTTERAIALRSAKPILSVDTGQQRFACPVGAVQDVQMAGNCNEVMTHAVTLDQVDQLLLAVADWPGQPPMMHAAGSALLTEPRAWLNAVRPGLALYRGAAKATAQLAEVHDSNRPAGYSGFIVPRFGVILAGYSTGIRTGFCRVNGQDRRILEVGMQSSFIELGPTDRTGDTVTLLDADSGLSEIAVAAAWKASPQEVLVRLMRLARPQYCHS